MDSVLLSRMYVEDWQRVRDIRLRALADSPDAFGSTLELEAAFDRTKWRERLMDAQAATFVLHTNAIGDVGIAVGAPHLHGDGAGLFSMWVAPEIRGRRNATVLIDAVVAWAKEQRYGALRLEVGDYNTAAIRLYERYGFTPTGTTSNLDPPRDHLSQHERVLNLC